LVLSTRDGRHIITTTPSHSQTRGGGGSFVLFTQNGHHVTNTTPFRSQTRGGGGSFVLLTHNGHHITNTTPLSLANARQGWFFCSFYSQWPPRHHLHPLSLANVRWGGGSRFFSLGTTAASPLPPPLTRNRELGVVLVYFTHNSCHITTTTPSRSQTRGGGYAS
jgi:hypothetical protein